MAQKPPRLHLEVTGATHRELGVSRGEQLRETLPGAYEKYAELFRILEVDEALELDGTRRVIDALNAWKPELVAEFEGIAEGSGLALEKVVALNARTELIALGKRASSECSTLTAEIAGDRFGVQTWDWHVELDPFWHTQEVSGPGLRFAGLTEQGILSKIGVNEAGLALHFNILGHQQDGPDGVPMHVLSSVVLSSCSSVDEAIALIQAAPIASSSAFTMLDAERAVSVEMSPAGVFVIEAIEGSVQRTNHFQHETPLAEQKSEVYEPDSSARLALVRERLASGLPGNTSELVRVLLTAAGEPPLTCVADMSKTYGERWASLATVVTEPQQRTIRVLDGMPTDAETGEWRVLTLG